MDIKERKKIAVLVVDDVEINVDILETALEEKYKVYRAYSGDVALEILNSHPEIAAIITDIQMPKMGGVKLIRTIRSDNRFADLVILVNTAFGDIQTEGEIRAMGVNGFLYKPNSPEDIEERLTKALNY